ncbi:hypothetical protein FA95DRAFT_1601673 [Auriscalpium vulgare]|uniref:Uncharacterized protein n=1 Tax=Auriscalpium vulgare TaxID=40419 RepID=A0ACB8S7P1_9AGAM|nr:hypothetical protein FA95DRAFT_1601673 [Auriscalpium vulgare]
MPDSAAPSAGARSTLNLLSEDNFRLARTLLRPLVPFDIHDYQLEGACALVQGTDLLACLPTGSGKTALFYLPLLLSTALKKCTQLPESQRARFPANQALLAVLPTNSLESEKETELQALGKTCGRRFNGNASLLCFLHPSAALTATLLDGERKHRIFRSLGLKLGQLHSIHRPNMRYDIQPIIRTLSVGLGGRRYPDLDWVLVRNRKTIIFCKIILLSFRVLVYLWHRAPISPSRSTRIRLYNLLISPAFNAFDVDFQYI